MIDVGMTPVAGPSPACGAGTPGSDSSAMSETPDFGAVLCAVRKDEQPTVRADTTDGEASSGAAVVDTLLAQLLGLPPSLSMPSEVRGTGVETPAAGDTLVSASILRTGAVGPDTDSAAGQVVRHAGVADVAAVAEADAPEVTSTVLAEPAATTLGIEGSEEVPKRANSEVVAFVAALRRAGGRDAPRVTDSVAATGQESRSVKGKDVTSVPEVPLGPNSSERSPGQAKAENVKAANEKEGWEAPPSQVSLGLKNAVDAVVSQAQPTVVTDQPSHVAAEASADAVATAVTQVIDRSTPAAVSQRPEARHSEDTALRERVIEQVVREVRLIRLPERNDLVVRLNPPELGTLRVHITQDARGISSQITASTEQVRHLLQANVPALVEALTLAGVKMDSVNVASDVSFGAFMDSSTQGSDYQHSGGQPRGHSQAAGPMLGALTLSGGSATGADSAGFSWLA